MSELDALDALVPPPLGYSVAARACASNTQPVEEDWFKPCAVIPIYHHERSLPDLVEALLSEDLPCLLVGDASNPLCAEVIDQLAQRTSVHLLRHSHSQEPGATQLSGLREAERLGFTHALQINTDEQLDLDAISRFLDRASQAPDALICGYTQQDLSAPKDQHYRRLLSQFWAGINTLSTSIRDATCGLRVYPLAPTLELADSVTLDTRTNLDSEIAIRMHWRTQPMYWLPTVMHCSAPRPSQTNLWRDMAQVSALHIRLLIGTLQHAPSLLRRRLQGYRYN